jgi:phosphoribosylamine---glycine ligase
VKLREVIAVSHAASALSADGLAAGKGVIVAQSMAEANSAIVMMFAGRSGAAGTEIVIEEFLAGEEASFFARCNGVAAIPLSTTAQDPHLARSACDSCRPDAIA